MTTGALLAKVTKMLEGPVPPTIAMDDQFRDIYCQAYRHALRDVLAAIASLDEPTPIPPSTGDQP